MTGCDVVRRLICIVKLFIIDYFMEISETASAVILSYGIGLLGLAKDGVDGRDEMQGDGFSIGAAVKTLSSEMDNACFYYDLSLLLSFYKLAFSLPKNSSYALDPLVYPLMPLVKPFTALLPFGSFSLTPLVPFMYPLGKLPP